jgi:hypothetical protein
VAQAEAKPLEVAEVSPVREPAVVLDFIIVNSIPMPQGALSWWRAAGNPNDAVSTNHGTLQNGATYGAGEVGQAFDLDGTNDFVQMPDNAAWAFGTNGFTIELWVNFQALGTNTIGEPEAIFVGNDEGSGAVNKWFFAVGGGILNFHVNSSQDDPVFLAGGTFSPQMDTWYHLAVVRSGSNFTFYTNGVSLGTVPTTNLTIPNPAAPLTLGQAEGIGFINGLIDELTIYNRGLAGSEILAIYNAGGAGKQSPNCVTPSTNAIGWWPSDGNNYDLARTNFATLTNGATYGAGEVGNAFVLDGNNDYVAVPDNDAWAFGTNNFTIELWVNFQFLELNWLEEPEAIFIGQDEGAGYVKKWFFALGGGYLNFHVNGPGLDPVFLVQAEFVPEWDRWYHLAAVRSNTTLTIYVDGTSVGTDTIDFAIPKGVAPLTMGQAEGIGFIDGLLDEVTIYNRALSGTEISAIYSAGWAGKCKVDGDQDGLTDLQEAYLGTSTGDSDSDDDALTDGDEVFVHHTNPGEDDTDGDGIPDGWEVQHGLNPLADDATLDADSDGWCNLLEWYYGTNPNSAASKPDAPPHPTCSLGAPNPPVEDPYSCPPGLTLFGPKFQGTNLLFSYADTSTNASGTLTNRAWDIVWKPALSTNTAWQFLATFAPGQTNLSAPRLTNAAAFFLLGSGADADGDGLSDSYEHLVIGTDWEDGDTDNDGLPDGWEISVGLDPVRNDLEQTTTGVEFRYDPGGRLKRVSESNVDVFEFDPEGNVKRTSP